MDPMRRSGPRQLSLRPSASSSLRRPTSPPSDATTHCGCFRGSQRDDPFAGGDFNDGDASVIIDWHSHIYTPEEAADDLGTLDGKHGPKWGERGCPMVLENFLEAHYENGIDISVVTNAAHYLRGKADHEELLAVQKWSDYAAEVQHTYKGTLFVRDHPALRRAGLHQRGRAARS